MRVKTSEGRGRQARPHTPTWHLLACGGPNLPQGLCVHLHGSDRLPPNPKFRKLLCAKLDSWDIFSSAKVRRYDGRRRQQISIVPRPHEYSRGWRFTCVVLVVPSRPRRNFKELHGYFTATSHELHTNFVATSRELHMNFTNFTSLHNH